MGELKVGRYLVKTTNEDFNLFGKSTITKGELVDYYYDIAPIMVPYCNQRPITMVRYPRGIDQEGFYQKEAPDYFPNFVKRVEIEKREDGSTTYAVINNEATLVYLANQACITPHLWLSKIDKINYPDKMIFDLDPPPGKSFSLVRKTALQLKDVLQEVGLVPFVKTTGSKGLHVAVPLRRTATFDEVRAFAKQIAEQLIKDNPKQLTLEIRKDKREGRIFIDTLRNAFAQTAVAPYAVRPKEKAPVATPISWDEVEDATLTSQRYTINNIFKRLEKYGDEWEGMAKHARSI